jgi:hypothetical protein
VQDNIPLIIIENVQENPDPTDISLQTLAHNLCLPEYILHGI